MELASILEILATITGVLMSLAYYPQAFKILKNKSAKDISLAAYSMFGVGSVIWLLWGVAIKSIPVILGYAAGALGSNLVVFLTLYYNSKSRESIKY